MRIPPNPNPAFRIRNTLIVIASLLGLWTLISLASGSQPSPASAPLITASTSITTVRGVPASFLQVRPGPLVAPPAPMRCTPWLRV